MSIPAASSSSNNSKRTNSRSTARRNASVKRAVSCASHDTNVPSGRNPPSVTRRCRCGCQLAREPCVWRQAEPATANTPPVIVPAPKLAPTEASRRWAALLQQIFEVDPLACPSCHGPMRIVAFITQASVIDQILTHLRARATPAASGTARSPPSTRRPSGPGAGRRRVPAAAHPAP